MKLTEYDNDAVVFITVPMDMYNRLEFDGNTNGKHFIALNEFEPEDHPESIQVIMQQAYHLGAELLYILPIATRFDVYTSIYHNQMVHYLAIGLNEDKASRLANIFAVRNTNAEYLKLESS
jgi:hypothetical protein